MKSDILSEGLTHHLAEEGKASPGSGVLSGVPKWHFLTEVVDKLHCKKESFRWREEMSCKCETVRSVTSNVAMVCGMSNIKEIYHAETTMGLP